MLVDKAFAGTPHKVGVKEECMISSEKKSEVSLASLHFTNKSFAFYERFPWRGAFNESLNIFLALLRSGFQTDEPYDLYTFICHEPLICSSV